MLSVHCLVHLIGRSIFSISILYMSTAQLLLMVLDAAKPRRSYAEQVEGRMSRLVSGRFRSLILNPSSSVSTNHSTTKALSKGNSFGSRFSSGVDFLSEGALDRTLMQFGVNLGRQKPPRLSIFVRTDAALLTDFSSLKNRRASSTLKFLAAITAIAELKP